MGKVQRPKGAGTKSLRLTIDGDVIEVRFDDNGEAEVQDQYLDAVLAMVPSLSKPKTKKAKEELPPEEAVEPTEVDLKENE